MMKSNLTITLLTACGALAFSSGCDKTQNTPPTPATNTQTPAAAAAVAPSQKIEAQPMADAEQKAQAAQTADVAKAAEAAKTEALKQQAAAENLAPEKLAQTAAAQDKDRIQSLIDTAKNLTGENKYAEALKVLGELSKLVLTPEQQALVDGLKKTAEQQAAKAATDKAASGATQAIGDALGGTK